MKARPLRRSFRDPAGRRRWRRAGAAGAAAGGGPRPSPLLRFSRPALLLLGVLVYGSVGYMAVEHWRPLDAVWMTVITITTVGYDEVHPLSDAGRLFTMTLILGGVGTMLWALGIFTEILGTGELGGYRRERAMEARRRALKDHFILCGYGRMGTRIVEEFEHERVSYVVIDNNPEAVARLKRSGRLFVDGDAASEEVLREACIGRARALISAVDSDERAVYIVLAARALNPDLYILSRAGHPDSIRRLELAGAQRVVSPYLMAGHQMASLALRPALVDVMDTLRHGDAEIGVEEVVVPAGSQLAGRTIGASGLTGDGAAQLLALRRRDGALHVNPQPALVLEEGDLIVALGSKVQLELTASLVQ